MTNNVDNEATLLAANKGKQCFGGIKVAEDVKGQNCSQRLPSKFRDSAIRQVKPEIFISLGDGLYLDLSTISDVANQALLGGDVQFKATILIEYNRRSGKKDL